MNIDAIKRLTRPKVVADDIAKKVFKATNDYKHAKQDVRFERTEALEPLLEKMDEEIKEIGKIQRPQLPAPQPQLALPQPIPSTPQPLPGPSQPSPSSPDPPPETPTKIFADLDKDFTEGDKEMYQKYGLILPSEALQAAYENPETETIDDNIDEAISINKSPGGKKSRLMKRSYLSPADEEKLATIERDIGAMRKLRRRLNLIKSG